MKDIDVYISVNDYIITTTGDIKENVITCVDNNDKITLVKFDIVNFVLIRDNDDVRINIDFKNKRLDYYFKIYDRVMNFDIEVEEFNREGNKFFIKYVYENQEFFLKIEYK